MLYGPLVLLSPAIAQRAQRIAAQNLAHGAFALSLRLVRLNDPVGKSVRQRGNSQ
jgi:hypothetical protein